MALIKTISNIRIRYFESSNIHNYSKSPIDIPQCFVFNYTWINRIFLGFTLRLSYSERAASTVLTFMLYWSEQIIRNCTCLLSKSRLAHTVNIKSAMI